ncbi:MAG: lysylphosphatidylglycerol synthase transmembrane domain-containing protein [Gammaproteobacteria bacterium]
MNLVSPPRHLIGLLVSALALWLASRQIEVEAFLDALRSADAGLIALSFAITVGVCLLRVARWRILFSFASSVGSNSLFSVLMIGFLANNLLPARLGDVAMAFLLHYKEGVGKSRSLGAIFLDRLFDVIALVALMSLVLLVHDLPIWVDWIVELGLAGCVVLFGFIWMTVRNEERSRELVERLTKVFPPTAQSRLMQVFVMAVEGMQAVHSPKRTMAALVASFLIWSSLGMGVFLLTQSFGFSLGLLEAVVVMGIVNLGLVIPSSPGFVGTFQLFCVAALSLYDIDKSSALSFSVMYHLSQWLPTTLIGYYYLNRENLRLGSIRELGSRQ